MFWTGVEAIAVCVYSLAFTLTIWFLYRQVRTAVKGFQLGAVQHLQQLVDNFRDDRRRLFHTFPLEIALSHEQFPVSPPRKYKTARITDCGSFRMSLTEEQLQAVSRLNDDQRELARRVIGRLNDIGELIEDGLIDRQVFLGKYHVMLIQCCHMVEAVRQDEELKRGGNYGQRLLRMRRWATTYNDIYPKHRAIPISVTNGREHRLVYQSHDLSLLQQLAAFMRRCLAWYG